jgi:type I restriction enzyme S subunit
MSKTKNVQQLSNDWEWVKLGEVCDIQTGKYDANHSKSKGKYRFYTCAYEFMYCDTNRFNGECLILPGNGANVGEVFYYNGEFDAYQRTYVLNKIKICPKYLYYHLLRNWKKQNQDKQFGSATNYIRLGNFTGYELPIPPENTQQAIVSKIEELFSELDKDIEELQKAQQQLKTYRQSVLKWAFEGRLTNENVKGGELPENWKWVKLGDLMESVRNGYSKKPDDNGRYKILRISSVRPNKVYTDEVRLLQEEIGIENSLRENDLLFTRYNGSIDFVGVCGRVPKLNESLFYPDKLIRCRPTIKEWYHSAYIDFAANSRLARQFVLSKVKTTAGQTGISGSDIKEIPIPIPPLEQQYSIVQAIECRLSVADKLENSVNQSLQKAEVLRQSILKNAFEGTLIS